MWYEELFDALESLGNSKKAMEMSRYMRDQFSFLGVARPERGLLYRKFYKNLGQEIDWNYIFLCFKKEEREYQYLAIDYLYKQKDLLTIADISRIHELIETKSWWDSVDGFPRVIGEIIKKDDDAKSIMLEWSRDRNFWVRRVAILHQLLFKEMTDTKLLEKIIVNNLESREFFINKAIGWILRDYSKTDKKWVGGFIERYTKQLDRLSIREGSKYL